MVQRYHVAFVMLICTEKGKGILCLQQLRDKDRSCGEQHIIVSSYLYCLAFVIPLSLEDNSSGLKYCIVGLLTYTQTNIHINIHIYIEYIDILLFGFREIIVLHPNTLVEYSLSIMSCLLLDKLGKKLAVCAQQMSF